MSGHRHPGRTHGRLDTLLLLGSILAIIALLVGGVWLLLSGELFRAGPVAVLTLLLAGGAFLRRGVDEHAVRRAVHQELMAFEAEATEAEIERRAPRGRR